MSRSLAARLAATTLVWSGTVAAQIPDGTSHPPSGEASPPPLEAQIGQLVGRPGGLTAEQAAARARTSSFDVKARRADAAVAGAGVNQAALGFVPRITLKGTYTRLSDVGVQSLGNVVAAAPGTALGTVPPGGTLSNVPLGFTFPDDNYALEADAVIPISDYVLRLADQYASARHSSRAAELTAKAAELNVASNARIRYYAWARSRLELVVAEAALELARQHLADAHSRFAEGQSPKADVLQVEAQEAERELFVARARSAVALEEDRLRTTLHDATSTTYAIGEPLLAELPGSARDADLHALLDEAERDRLELRAMRETSEGLHSQARAQRVGLLPRLDGVASALYANPNPRYFPPPAVWHGTWAVGASVSWASADAIFGGTGASAASARAESADAQERVIGEGIRDEVMQAYEGLRNADTAVASSQRSLVASEEAYRVRRALFRAAQATGTELSDAETALTGARFESVDARIDLRIARVRLDHATGRDATAP